jgi:hypothetical protein
VLKDFGNTVALYLNPHPPNCPWHAAAEQVGAPNIKWCETSLCGWISEPSNTWSNVLYLVLGLVVYLQCRRSMHLELRWMGPAMMVMGLLSGLYHASNNYVTQWLDFLGMFLLIDWFLVINLRRNGWIAVGHSLRSFAAIFSVSLLLVHAMYLLHGPFQVLVALTSVAVIATEFTARRHVAERVPLRYFGFGLALMALAQTASLADLTRALCDPDNHFVQGHAAWHLLSAIALFCSVQHYRQLPYEKVPA